MKKLNNEIAKAIHFISPNLLKFFLNKRKENVTKMLILVMIMLQYFPRFQKARKTTNWIKSIRGQEPKSFDNFIFTNKDLL